MDGIQTQDTRDLLERRAKIVEFERLLGQQDGAFFGDSEQAPLEHFFTEGLYSRKILLPEGLLCVGKIHKHQHPYVVLSGRCMVYTEDAGSFEIKAPFFGISPAGTKRVVLALEDTVWITFHRTEATTPKDAEAELIAPDFAALGSTERKEIECHS